MCDVTGHSHWIDNVQCKMHQTRLEVKRTSRVYLTDMDITEDTVEKKLNKLKVTKSSGPDRFHPRILSELSKSIKSPLCVIFNKSLQEGRLPESWKDAHVTPIHKKGKKTTPGNYRPVSLTSGGRKDDGINSERPASSSYDVKRFIL